MKARSIRPKALPSKISLYAACMAIHNGSDNRFYVNVWDPSQNPLCKLNFNVCFQTRLG